MEAPRFRWWADELSAAVAAAPPPQPRRSRAPKKRSISDLFAAAPPLPLLSPAAGGGTEAAPAADDDEALCAIMRRAREKKRKRRLQAGAASAASPASAEEGNIPRKEAFDKINSPDGLDTPQASKKPEGSDHLRTDKEKVPELKRRKHVNINNLEKKKKEKKKTKRTDTLKHTESKKAIKVGKAHDLKKMLPLHSILKKYTKHTSVKMVKEKHGNSKGTEVIELCRKSVKRVKFSEVNDVLGIKKQTSKLPQLESLCKLFSDAIASSSSSSTDMSSEADRHLAAESSSSHMPEEAFSKDKEAHKNTDNEDPPELSSTKLSSHLIDLNEALPESTDLNYPYVSNSEEPNLEPTQNEPLYTDAQVTDGGKNQKNVSFDSYRLECQPPAAGLESVTNSVSAETFLRVESTEVSGTHIVCPPLKLRERASSHDDCSSYSVKDNRMKGKSPCALPNSMVEDSSQQHQNWLSFNLNHGDTQFSNGNEIPPWRSRECSMSHSESPSFHSVMDVQKEGRPAAGQTVRLMGRNLAVSTPRGEYLAETAQKQADSYIKDQPATDVFLKLPREGQPFLSLQAQSVPNVYANSASTSQSHFRYTTPHNIRQPFPAASYFSNREPHENVLLGCPTLHNHGNTAVLHQNSPAPWRCYSGPVSSSEQPSAPFLSTTTQHVRPSSVYHANLSQPCGMFPASSSVRPHNSASFTFNHPGQVVEAAPGSRRDAALPYRNTGSTSDAALPSRIADNVRMTAAVPDKSKPSSSGRYVQRSGPVKLIPGAKHILMPSDSTGNDTSVPVYSCVSFGSRSENVSAPQNKRAELYKF